MFHQATHTISRSNLGGRNEYRFSFNGKEKDKEGMGGGGSTYDYGFRIYNAQLGKFLSVDPLTFSYPWYTPYQFAGNKPTRFLDLDGLEEYDPMQDPYLFTRLALTTFYDTKHAAYNLLLAFGPAQPGMKWQAGYKQDGQGNEIFETQFLQVPRENLAKEALSLSLDALAVLSLRGGFDGTDLLASKTNSVTNLRRVFQQGIEMGGSFVKKNHYMSDISKQYQKQINGIAGDVDFNYNGVNYDGLRDGVLLEAKGLGYNKLFSNEKFGDQVMKTLLDQASRQVKAANGAKVEWNFAEEGAANTFREALGKAGIEGIDVKHTPIEFKKK